MLIIASSFSSSSTTTSRRIKQNLITIHAFVVLVCLASQAHGQYDLNHQIPAIKVVPPQELTIKRSDLPSDFLIGGAVSAMQSEGAVYEGGRGQSVMDYLSETNPAKFGTNDTLSVSIDTYHRYKEDIQLLKQLGIDTYRFSISWTRILPNGSLELSGGVNKEGINFYNSFIDELVKNNIKPFVTLLHFDSPQALQEKYGGFLNRSMVNDFKSYCKICFETFGDRVKNWITINEPTMISTYGYDQGFGPPGRCSDRTFCPSGGNSATEPYIVTHNLLLAHAAVARLYKEEFQKKQGGEIGITLAGIFYEPYSQLPEDIEATKRALNFSLGWLMAPLVYGEYPPIMRQLVKDRLPNFTLDETNMVKGSYDFIGLNYYSSRFVKHVEPKVNATPISGLSDSFTMMTDKNEHKEALGPPVAGGSCLYPLGIKRLLVHVKQNYQNPKVYITENGVAEERDDKIPVKDSLDDQHRIDFVKRHLYWINEAAKSEVNVKGYMYWVPFDAFEFKMGYTLRNGFYYIDYLDNLKRYPKKSAQWMREFMLEGKTQVS